MEVLTSIDTDRIHTLRERGEFFWLRLVNPSTDDLNTLSKISSIDELALEDTHQFGQRVKFDGYEHNSLLVCYGAQPDKNRPARLVEVHLHISSEALITVAREPLTALDDARQRTTAGSSVHEAGTVYIILDAVADSLLEALEGYDDAIDELQAAVAEHATTANRQRIFALRRQLAEMRQVVVPQRDLLGPGGTVIEAVGNQDSDHVRNSFRDVHDHLDRATTLVASYREQLASLLDLYLTEVSTRLNEIMKRLTLIATVFLPLSFLAGFFGMNFGWLQQVITPLWTFFVFGVGLSVVSVAAVVIYLRRTAD